MRFGGVFSAAILAAVLGGGGALAEMNLNGPAEVPPTSYKGRQYVDSAGCVFVRAGFGNAVNWVPRVSRDKKQLCGYKPTFQGGEAVLDVAKAAPAPAPTPAPAPPAVAAAKPAPAAPVAAPPKVAAAPAPRPVSPFAPATGVGKPMETIALTTEPPRVGRTAQVAAAPIAPKPVPAPALTAPAPAQAPMQRAGYVSPYAAPGAASLPAGAPRYRNTVPLPAAAPTNIVSAVTVDVASTSCPAGTATAQRYTLSDGRRVVRCGEQVQNPAAFINGASVPGLVVAAATPPSGYVSPYAVAPMIGGTGYAVSGYAPSANYAAPTAPMYGGTGYAVSQADYAAQSPYQAVPEAVHVRLPGQPVTTTLAPVIVATKTGPTGYRAAFDDGRLNPFRGPRSAMGDAAQGQVWTNEVPAELVSARTPARKLIVPMGQAAAPVARVSSKSVALSVPQGAAARFVQVGTFGVPANAEAAKARLRAAGLPVASSTTTRGGKRLTIVLSGPFAGADGARALGAARAAGFGDAILR